MQVNLTFTINAKEIEKVVQDKILEALKKSDLETVISEAATEGIEDSLQEIEYIDIIGNVVERYIVNHLSKKLGVVVEDS